MLIPTYDLRGSKCVRVDRQPGSRRVELAIQASNDCDGDGYNDRLYLRPLDTAALESFWANLLVAMADSRLVPRCPNCGDRCTTFEELVHLWSEDLDELLQLLEAGQLTREMRLQAARIRRRTRMAIGSAHLHRQLNGEVVGL